MKVCRVEVRTSFLVFLAVFYFINPAHTFWPFCFAAALHEGGHILALKVRKIDIQSICLTGSGAIIRVGDSTYCNELLVSVAGPLVNAVLFFLMMEKKPVFALVNFGLLCYNLLPVYPLDGGRILRAFLCIVLPENVALCLERGSGAVSLLVLMGGAVYLTCGIHVGLWPVLLVAFLLVRVGGTISPISNFVLDKQEFPCYNKQANSERCPSGLRSRS